jgi:hypothetical protein
LEQHEPDADDKKHKRRDLFRRLLKAYSN